MKLPNTARPIKDSRDHWIDINGDVYAIDHRNYSKKKLIKKAQTTIHGYKYCGIFYPNRKGIISKRVHRLVAEAFIENPKNYTIIGHRNNIKSDNRVQNLYWTTISENTQKACDDGLLKNDKGFDDSQSKPVIMFDTKTNKRLETFGSITEASKITGISKSTIARQSKYKRPVRKPFYFRYTDSEDCTGMALIGEYDYDTNELLNVYINSKEAHLKTSIPKRTILNQIENGKPSRKTRQSYFLRTNNNYKV